MGVVATQAQAVQDFLASPPVIQDVRKSQGRVHQSITTVAVAAADDDDSVYYVLPVHSSWAITSIKVFNDAITSGTGYDVGLYTVELAAINDDIYASAISMATARVTDPAELAVEGRDINILGRPVWEDAGATEDPFLWYLLALTADTVGSAAGDITVVVQYTTD